MKSRSPPTTRQHGAPVGGAAAVRCNKEGLRQRSGVHTSLDRLALGYSTCIFYTHDCSTYSVTLLYSRRQLVLMH